MAFQPRIDENGRDCCTRITPDGKAYGLRVAGKLRACSKCQEHHGARWRAMQAAERRTTEEHTNILKGTTMTDDYAPPDSYAPALHAFRTPEQRLAAEHQATQVAGIKAEADAIAAENDARFRALDTHDLGSYAAPDPYRDGIKALQERGR